MTSSTTYKKKDIKERLLALYSEEEAIKADILITKLIASYHDKIVSKPYKMTQEDVILITYGDQLIEPGVEPMQTLGKFLDENVKGIINTVHI